jgi:DNA modification methylase
MVALKETTVGHGEPSGLDGPRPRLRLEWIEAQSLGDNPNNWRRHPEPQLNALRGVLNDAEVGWAGALLYNEATGRLIDGHARKRVVEPTALVPVLIGRWSEAAEQKVLATLDPLAAMATADLRQLESLLANVDLDEACFAGVKDELDTLIANAQKLDGVGDVLEPEVPAPPDKATTQMGDLWILGEHRLLCGDSAKAEDVDRLLDGVGIQLCNTDPPYGVKVEPRSNNAIAAGLSSFEMTHHQKLDVERHPEKSQGTTKKLRAKDRPLVNDFVSEEQFDHLLDAWFGNIARVLDPGRSFYIWGGYANCANYPPVLKRHGLYFSQSIIWDKQHPVLTRKDFMGAHEWAFYGWREGAAHVFYGPANVPDLWAIKKVNPQSMVHLTEKPCELAVRAMQYSSRAGENVLDLFGGSGSTLMAAEQFNRKAFLMELDPLYCDVIVQRWETFTGKKAERVKAA